MNLYSKVTGLAVLAAATAIYASADSITIGSGGSNTNTTYYNGYTAGTGGNFNDLSPVAADFANGANSATMTIGTGGGTWSVGPITGTSWITGASLGDTSPGHNVVTNGYYEFTTSFTTSGGNYTGSFSVMADDTVAIFLNGTLILQAGSIGSDGHCSDVAPNCGKIDTFDFGSATAGFNSNGVNNLTFIVEQTGASAFGLDYSATVDNGTRTVPTVPEPSSLVLLGTGLVGSAGAVLRRMRKA